MWVAPRLSVPSTSMSISTAAISSNASVAEWKPPVSTSTATGRKPRKRRDISSAAGCSEGTAEYSTWLIGACLRCDSPCNPFAGAQRHDRFLAERIARGDLPGLFDERDPFFIARQVVEVRAEVRCKALQSLQSAHAFEGLRVQLDGGGRGEHTGASTSRFLRAARVWRAVRAEEESRIAAGDDLRERAPVSFRLEHGQAVVMRADSPIEQRIAIHQQMLRSESGCDARAGAAHEFRGGASGDVLEDDPQARKTCDQRSQHIVDEARFAIEHIDRGAGDLAVHLQNDSKL